MNRIHPESKDISQVYKTSGYIHIWRSKDGVFYECSFDPFVQFLEELVEFSLEEYINVIRENNLGIVPNGYYYVDHQMERGGFLGTDDYQEAMEALMIRGLISPA